MSKKIFRSIMAVTLIVFVAVFITAIGFLYNYFVKLQVSRLKDELTIVSASVNDEGVKYFDKFNSSVFRLTLISSDGNVMYDSQADPESMGIIWTERKFQRLLPTAGAVVTDTHQH